MLLTTGQHGLIRALLKDICAQKGEERRMSLDRLRAYLAAHDAWEQGWIHPLAAACLRAGGGHPGDVDHRLEEERDAGAVLDRLREMPEDSPTFDLQCELFAEAVGHHANDEEERELPVIEAAEGPLLGAGIGRAIWVGREVPEVSRDLASSVSTERFRGLLTRASARLEASSGIPVAS